MILAVSPFTTGPLLGYESCNLGVLLESVWLNVAPCPKTKLKEHENVSSAIATSNDPLKDLSVEELACTCVEYTQTILATISKFF